MKYSPQETHSYAGIMGAACFDRLLACLWGEWPASSSDTTGQKSERVPRRGPEGKQAGGINTPGEVWQYLSLARSFFVMKAMRDPGM